MTQPTPVGVEHVPGQGTRYHVRGLAFTRPKDAIRAAEAFDRGITYVSPLRSGSDLTGGYGAPLRAESDSERSGYRSNRRSSPDLASGALEHPESSVRAGTSRVSGSPVER